MSLSYYVAYFQTNSRAPKTNNLWKEGIRNTMYVCMHLGSGTETNPPKKEGMRRYHDEVLNFTYKLCT